MKKTLLMVFVPLLASAVVYLYVCARWGELLTYMCRDTQKPFFSRQPAGTGGYIVLPNRSGVSGEGFKFLMPKPKGVKRIFVAGESAAGLLADAGKRSFTAVIREAMGANTEIINCGMGAYDSGRISEVFRELLAYEPDLVIVLSGNNEFGIAIETCPDGKGLLTVLKRLSRVARRLPFSPLRRALRDETISNHKDRLELMAELGRGKNVPVMFLTLPVDLKDFPPYGPMPLFDRNFSAGLREFESGQLADALSSMENFIRDGNDDPFGLFYAGRILSALGREKEALVRYRAAVEQDWRHDRASARNNTAIRAAAAAPGACLADLEKAFERLSPGGTIGGELMVDGPHWFTEYNYLAGYEVLKSASGCAARRLLRDGGTGPPPAGGRYRADDRRAESEKVAILLNYAAAYIIFMDREGKDYLNMRVVSILDKADRGGRAALLRALRSKETLAGLLRENTWVRSRKPGMAPIYPVLLAHAAEMYRGKKQYALAEEFLAAASSAPASAGLKLTKARLACDLGAHDEAKRLFMEILDSGGGRAAAISGLLFTYGLERPGSGADFSCLPG